MAALWLAAVQMWEVEASSALKLNAKAVPSLMKMDQKEALVQQGATVQLMEWVTVVLAVAHELEWVQ